MASEDGGRSAGAPDNSVNARWGARRGCTRITIDGEVLASSLASHEQLQKAAEQYMIASTREIMLLRAANSRLERQVASLQQQVGDPALRRGEGSAAPGENDKPL